MYERLFCWIVGRINDVIEVKNYDARVHGKNTVIGVLDIYGFEIFQNNRFVLNYLKRKSESLQNPFKHLRLLHMNAALRGNVHVAAASRNL